MEELLERLWYFDFEVFAHDTLSVFISHSTREIKVFHNSTADEYQTFINTYSPILAGYNSKGYDKYILKACLLGYTPEEIKEVNDYIISGGNGWEYPFNEYCELPIVWDFMNEIVPRKSLKEIEGNLRLDITETTVPFDTPTKWTTEQYEEVLYYCTCDVKALMPLFEKLMTNYKSKYIICKLGGIEPAYGLSLTNANLTATLLGATRQDYDDPFGYVYPEQVQKEKIPKEALDFFDDLIKHNDINYKLEAPCLSLKDIDFQIGVGGGHGFIKHGVYYYERGKSKKVLCNFDVSSLYPNLVRLFGYSSRSQSDKDAYVNLLDMRMKAKKKALEQSFLDSIGLTIDELKLGLKLPLNAYTGALRAVFNALYDNLQGFSICTTGQLLILQLIHDLEKVPTLQMVSANTDAVMFEIAPEYKEQALKILHDWEELTGLELEEDNIVKIVMANVNNYCELIQTGENDYTINYKGGRFECNSLEKNLKLKWNKETKTFDTIFTDDIKSNSLTIVGEALLKELLLDIPVEETINNCNDIFRFQKITHLGGTYDRIVQETKDEDVVLQKNNRVYAGKKEAGILVKIKPDGRRDSLAECPTNPIVDNANKCTINDIDKEWYISVAKQRVNDFRGVKRLEEHLKQELLDLAKNELGINIEEPSIKKLKKVELIELIKNIQKETKKDINTNNVYNYQVPNNNLPNNKIKDLAGFINGKLTVIRFIKTINGKSYWECKCDCGKIFIRRSDAIKSNKINGCLQCSHRFSDRKKNSQGDSVRSGKYYRLYRIWKGMKDRCYLQSSKHFDRYGGRGIKICKEWKSNYIVFKEWALQNGYNDTLSIERKNIDKDYEPSNCCWIPLSMQNKNTSRTWRIRYKNIVYTLSDLSEYLCIPRTTLRRYLLKNDMNVDKCIKNYNERTIRNAKKRY